MIRRIQRGVIDASLKAARLPLDTAARLFGGEKTRIDVDRADAEVRDVAGRVLLDGDLREDARLRRVAAQAKERKRNVRQTEVKREERIEKDAKRERLEALDRKAEALDRKADAATARNEAQRLRRAAAEAKAERKERAKQV